MNTLRKDYNLAQPAGGEFHYKIFSNMIHNYETNTLRLMECLLCVSPGNFLADI